MKIVVINGSPRKGNIYSAIKAFEEGVNGKHEVEVIDATRAKIAPCKACMGCQRKDGCVDKDDTNAVIDKLAEADMLLFASPVYWWGITAQTKLVLDKMYCRAANMKGKKIGTIIIGEDAVEALQYKLVKQQFECIADYLEWEQKFHLWFSAENVGDLDEQAEAIAKIKEAAAAL